MSSFGERLRDAIENRPRKGREGGIRLFHKEMKARRDELKKEGGDLVGVALPSIHSYLQDRTAPPDEFVREAASLLGVFYEWLANGTGPRFPEEKEEWVERALWADGARRRANRDLSVIEAAAKHKAPGMFSSSPADPDQRDAADQAYNRRSAIMRFGAKLNDSGTIGMGSREVREDLLVLATQFAEGVDELLGRLVKEAPIRERSRIGSLVDLVKVGTLGDGGDAGWYDAVLSLIDRRTLGLSLASFEPANLYQREISRRAVDIPSPREEGTSNG